MDTKGDRVRETKTERQREGQQAREEEMGRWRNVFERLFWGTQEMSNSRRETHSRQAVHQGTTERACLRVHVCVDVVVCV